MTFFFRQIGGGEIDGDAADRKRKAGSNEPERTCSLASDTALSGSPTMVKAGRPGATCTYTPTAWASIPSKATVATR